MPVYKIQRAVHRGSTRFGIRRRCGRYDDDDDESPLLFLLKGNRRVEVHIWGFCFKVELASRSTCKAEYDKKAEDSLKDSRTAVKG